MTFNLRQPTGPIQHHNLPFHFQPPVSQNPLGQDFPPQQENSIMYPFPQQQSNYIPNPASELPGSQLYRPQINSLNWNPMESPMSTPGTNGRQQSVPLGGNPVVGRQGTRGPLPIDNGDNPLEDTEIEPEQRPDGKWGCPSCDASFSFPKHVKRHYMRHTGERPYACLCCNTTFARSDVLKRHFEKCAERTPGWRDVPKEQRLDHLQGRRGRPRRSNKKRRGSSKNTPASSPKDSTPDSENME